MGGLMSITGHPDGEPTKVGVALVDVLTAKDATVGILAALATRARTGLGQRVEVNLLSSLLGSLVNQASSFLATGQSPGRMGNAHPSIAPYESLRCADGAIAVACGNDGQFVRLCSVLGSPHLSADPRFATNANRVLNRAALVASLEELLATNTATHWVTALTAAGLPAGQVGDLASAFELASSLGLDPLVDVGSQVPAQVRNPITFSATPVTDYRPPPRLGEHDDDVRRWLTTSRQEDHS